MALAKRMSNGVSEYLSRIKDWKVRNMVAGYVEASERFRVAYAAAKPKAAFPHKVIGEICDILYELKEDHHIIFKRLFGPESIQVEDEYKFEPNQADIEFIANVGMLFHQILVAREIKYIQMHYDPLTNSAATPVNSFENHLEQIRRLFDAGTNVLLEFIRNYADNVILASFILENEKKLANALGLRGTGRLQQIVGHNQLDETYYLVSQYYTESGRYDQAEKLLNKVIHINPKHTEARRLLDEAKLHQVQ